MEIKEKANYCLSCPVKPCQQGCPLGNDTQGFIKLMKSEKYAQAYQLLSQTTVLSSICGRICPHMSQCEGKCVRRIRQTPVEIGNLEAFVGDYALENGLSFMDKPALKEQRVAVVGSGPSGLTCAAFLRKAGFQVDIYEKHSYAGGLLRHGIPEFRLPKTIVDQVVAQIEASGVNFYLNAELGKNLRLADLKTKYDAVYIAIGANISSKMNIPGEELNGVYGGNELLEKGNHPVYEGKTVIVSGGGNVAMDVSRTVKRLGAAKVIVVYRRSEKEMPAEAKEIMEAKEEGIEFLFQNNIIAIHGQDHVESIECLKTELVAKEGETRLTPVNIEGSNYRIPCDYVMMAVGSLAEKAVTDSLGLETDRKGKLVINADGSTSDSKIFAGGDVANCKGTVAWAARAGRNAAEAIIESFK